MGPGMVLVEHVALPIESLNWEFPFETPKGMTIIFLGRGAKRQRPGRMTR